MWLSWYSSDCINSEKRKPVIDWTRLSLAQRCWLQNLLPTVVRLAYPLRSDLPVCRSSVSASPRRPSSWARSTQSRLLFPCFDILAAGPVSLRRCVSVVGRFAAASLHLLASIFGLSFARSQTVFVYLATRNWPFKNIADLKGVSFSPPWCRKTGGSPPASSPFSPPPWQLKEFQSEPSPSGGVRNASAPRVINFLCKTAWWVEKKWQVHFSPLCLSHLSFGSSPAI